MFKVYVSISDFFINYCPFLNQVSLLKSTLTKLTQFLERIVVNYEIIMIDNASEDSSLLVLKELAVKNGLPNLQVFSLTSSVYIDIANSIGIENALG